MPGLNESKGNMYEWVTHTWNTIKGACEHDCSYCYMKRWGKLNPVRFDETEIKTDLGFSNFIFVGSSCDMFSKSIPDEWISKTLEHCRDHHANSYLFQTKNPSRLLSFIDQLKDLDFRICTTIESNRYYPEIMRNSPHPTYRAINMNNIEYWFKLGFPNKKLLVTIEPILDFDLKDLTHLIETCLPYQVNIGANSGKENLPEPSNEKILELISELEKFTKVKLKKNLNRLLK